MKYTRSQVYKRILHRTKFTLSPENQVDETNSHFPCKLANWGESLRKKTRQLVADILPKSLSTGCTGCWGIPLTTEEQEYTQQALFSAQNTTLVCRDIFTDWLLLCKLYSSYSLRDPGVIATGHQGAHTQKWIFSFCPWQFFLFQSFQKRTSHFSGQKKLNTNL